MKNRLLYLPLLAALLFACGENTGDEDTTPPAAPVLVEKFCDPQAPEYPEEGIDAEAAGAGIKLEWLLAETTADLEGFVVYRALSTNQDSLSPFVDISPDPTEYLIGSPQVFRHLDATAGISPDIHGNYHEYWYFVRGLDQSGNLSAPSDTARFTLLRSPRVLSLDAAGDSLRLVWGYDLLDASLAGFHILILDDADQLAWYADVQTGFGGQDYERAWSLPEEDLPAGSYRLRVDAIFARPTNEENIDSNPLFCPLAGGESEWISFQR